MNLRILAATVSALTLAVPAQASVNVSIWQGSPAATAAANNATVAQAATLGAPTITGTVSAIDFASPPAPYTVGGFLNNAALGSSALANSYLLFTGGVFLNAGSNTIALSHDDGAQLFINGSLVVDSPLPTVDITNNTTFSVLTAGIYNFQLAYGENGQAPADLTFKVNGQVVRGVPEPATWGMMLLGFAGIGFAMRTRRRPTIAQVA